MKYTGQQIAIITKYHKKMGEFAQLKRTLASAAESIESNLGGPIPSMDQVRTIMAVKAASGGRNDPCSCGSGMKFKRCCMAGALKSVPESVSVDKDTGVKLVSG